MATIFLLDRSDSIREADRQKQEDFVGRAASVMGDQDEMGIIVFGRLRDTLAEAI